MLWRRCHFDHSCSQNDPVHPAENNVGARSGFFPNFFFHVSGLLRRRFTQEHFVQKQVQADPRRKRTVENILQTFVDDVSCSCSRFLLALPTASNSPFAARAVFPPRQGDIFVSFRPQEHLQLSQPRGGFHISWQAYDCAGRSPAASQSSLHRNASKRRV